MRACGVAITRSRDAAPPPEYKETDVPNATSEQITQARANLANAKETIPRLLRLATHAQGILDRHPLKSDDWCEVCREVWPCPEVVAVVQAWTA